MAITNLTIELEAKIANEEEKDNKTIITTNTYKTYHAVGSEKYKELIEVATNEMLEELDEELCETEEIVSWNVYIS